MLRPAPPPPALVPIMRLAFTHDPALRALFLAPPPTDSPDAASTPHGTGESNKGVRARAPPPHSYSAFLFPPSSPSPLSPSPHPAASTSCTANKISRHSSTHVGRTRCTLLFLFPLPDMLAVFSQRVQPVGAYERRPSRRRSRLRVRGYPSRRKWPRDFSPRDISP